MQSKTIGLLLLAACIVLLTGCVRESTSGQRHEFAFQWWVSAVVLVVGAGLVLAGGRALIPGWKRYDSKTRMSWVVAMIFGFVIALGLAPSTFLYRIIVDQNGFSIRSGVGGTSIKDVKFNNLSRIEMVTTLSSTRGHAQRKYLLKCESKSGSTETIPLHDAVWSAVAKAAVPLIEQNARTRGVVVVHDR